MQTHKILVIDDHKEVLTLLELLLTQTKQFSVETCLSGLEGMTKLKREKFDLAIIDLNLENISGKSIVEEIRREGHSLPVIMLTATDSPTTIVDCFNAGADDYIVKPFDAKVLIARVNNLLRRSGIMEGGQPIVLTHSNIELNKDTVQVTREGKVIGLTAKEFQLLKFLMENKGKVISRSSLMNNVWGYDNIAQARVVDVHISNLRKKMNSGFKDALELVETVRGFGYRVL